MQINESRTIADMVTENIRTAHVFRKYGIDFCCGGGVSLRKASEKAKIDYEKLSEELLKVDTPVQVEQDFNNRRPDELADHISNVHHKYIEENIPLIIGYANRVVQVHGQHYPELIQIQRLFSEAVIELGGHTMKEENILFPFIKEMVRAEGEGITPEIPSFGTVDNPIKVMEQDHEEVAGIFRRIAALANGYTPPSGVCNTFRAFYSKLEEFNEDLQQHVHLESNILFPKAIELEKKLFPEED